MAFSEMFGDYRTKSGSSRSVASAARCGCLSWCVLTPRLGTSLVSVWPVVVALRWRSSAVVSLSSARRRGGAAAAVGNKSASSEHRLYAPYRNAPWLRCVVIECTRPVSMISEPECVCRWQGMNRSARLMMSASWVRSKLIWTLNHYFDFVFVWVIVWFSIWESFFAKLDYLRNTNMLTSSGNQYLRPEYLSPLSSPVGEYSNLLYAMHTA